MVVVLSFASRVTLVDYVRQINDVGKYACEEVSLVGGETALRGGGDTKFSRSMATHFAKSDDVLFFVTVPFVPFPLSLLSAAIFCFSY